MPTALTTSRKPIWHLAELKNNGTTTALSVIDRLWWNYCTFFLRIGATDTTFNAKVQESADGSTGWADIAGAAIAPLSATDDGAELAVEVDLSAAARKRYIRLLGTAGNGATGVEVQCLAVLSDARNVEAAIAQADLAEVVES